MSIYQRHCNRQLLLLRPDGGRSIVLSVSVCVRVSVCLSVGDHIFGATCPIFTIFVRVTYGRGSVLLWRRCDMLRISGFTYDVMFHIG